MKSDKIRLADKGNEAQRPIPPITLPIVQFLLKPFEENDYGLDERRRRRDLDGKRLDC